MFDPILRLYRARTLVRTLAAREIKARYRGHWFGYVWSLVNPLLLLAVYSLVFTLVFAQRAGSIHPYPLFLFGGILLWNFVASALLDSAETFRANGPLLRKVIVDPEVFPGVAVAAQAFHFLLALPILVAATVALGLAGRVRVGWLAVQFVPIVLLLGAAVLGGALLISAVSVHFRDVRDLLQNLLTLAFFATPVIYSTEGLSSRLRLLLQANPATPYFTALHDAIFFGRPVAAVRWLEMAAVAAVSLALGSAVFSRLRDSIAEEA